MPPTHFQVCFQVPKKKGRMIHFPKTTGEGAKENGFAGSSLQILSLLPCSSIRGGGGKDHRWKICWNITPNIHAPPSQFRCAELNCWSEVSCSDTTVPQAKINVQIIVTSFDISLLLSSLEGVQTAILNDFFFIRSGGSHWRRRCLNKV